MPQPNLLFVMTDQQKATSLDLYSEANSVETVSLRQLADAGTRFDAAYCPYPLCVPSRIAMLSGQYPSHSGYLGNRPEMGNNPRSLFPHLHRHGYRTMMVGKDHAHGTPRNGDPGDAFRDLFDWVYRGFHGARMSDETNRDQPHIEPFLKNTEELHQLWGSATAPWDADDSLSAELSRRACGFLDQWDRDDRPHDRPFAMWLSYPDPHEFYQAPRDAVEAIDPESIALYPNEDSDIEQRAEYIRFMHWYFNAGGVPEDVRRRLTRVYLAMCKNVDDQLLRVFDRLRDLGQWDNTVIVFLSDHGDLTGEHGLLQKFNCGYDGCCRVPMLIAAPGRTLSGRASANPVNLVDVSPTLCDLLDVEPWTGMQGHSLAPLLLDGNAAELPPYTVVESGLPGEHLTTADIRNFPEHRWDVQPEGRWCYDPPHRFGGRMYAVRSERYKLIVREQDRLELYDMAHDSWERRNVADRDDLRGVVIEHMQSLADHLGRIIPMQPGTRIAPQDAIYRAGGGRTWRESIEAARS